MSRWWLVVMVVSVGCDDATWVEAEDPCPPAYAEGPDGCVFDEEAVAEVVRTFDDGGLVPIDAGPFVQYMGTQIRRRVWVSPTPLDGVPLTAADLYALVDPEENLELPAEFPVGTVIVHEAVDREEGHAVQVKRDDWDDGTGRTWWTAKLFDDGTPDAGACSPCTDCHNSSARPLSEGLWGVPRAAM